MTTTAARRRDRGLLVPVALCVSVLVFYGALAYVVTFWAVQQTARVVELGGRAAITLSEADGQANGSAGAGTTPGTNCRKSRRVGGSAGP